MPGSGNCALQIIFYMKLIFVQFRVLDQSSTGLACIIDQVVFQVNKKKSKIFFE